MSSANTATSEVLWWSGATVGSLSVIDVATQLGKPLNDAGRARIEEDVRRAADRIIAGKGATWFGIGAGLSRVVQAIGRNENALLSVSARAENIEGVGDVTLSLPRIVGAGGICGALLPHSTRPNARRCVTAHASSRRLPRASSCRVARVGLVVAAGADWRVALLRQSRTRASSPSWVNATGDRNSVWRSIPPRIMPRLLALAATGHASSRLSSPSNSASSSLRSRPTTKSRNSRASPIFMKAL